MEIFQTIVTALTTENVLLIQILSIPLCFIEAILNLLLFTTLLNISATPKQKLQYVLSISILALIAKNMIPTPYGGYINLVIGLFLIKYIFKTNFIKAFLSILIPTLIMLLAELCFIRLYHCIFGISFDATASIPFTRISSVLMIYGILFLIYKLIKHFKVALTILDNFNKNSKTLLVIDMIAGFVLVSVQLYLTAFYINDVPGIITLLSSLCLIAYCIISLYSIINVSKLETTAQNLEREHTYNKNLNTMYEKLREFRHDFGNIIQALGGYIDSQDIEGLRKYYSTLKKDCVSVNNLQILNPDTLNNPALYSLLTAKYHRAREYDIHVDLDVFLDFTELEHKVSIYELSRILGVLLDNAIEAAKDCDYRHIIIKIHKDPHNRYALFEILNTYTNKDIDIEKIFHKNYSTKKEQGNSGLGLWEVHKYLSKHTELDLYTTKSDNYFSQELKIFY